MRSTYRSLLVLLNEIYRIVLMAQFGFSEDVREIRVFNFTKEFVHSVNSTPHLELTEPLKLCVFAAHVVEFAEKVPRSNELHRREGL